MRKIAALPTQDRRDLFTETGVRMGLPPFHVENNFWVCWTLSTLFGDENGDPASVILRKFETPRLPLNSGGAAHQ